MRQRWDSFVGEPSRLAPNTQFVSHSDQIGHAFCIQLSHQCMPMNFDRSFAQADLDGAARSENRCFSDRAKV
jgi:hypothetical protein